MKKIVLLGASGSIGQQTIDIINQHSDLYEIIGLSVGKNVDFLCECLERFKTIKFVCSGIDINQSIKNKYSDKVFFFGDEGLCKLASVKTDLLVNALQGFVGLLPTIKAIESGNHIALANKETLVAAGEIVMSKAKSKGVIVFPIDSEHSAIYQCLLGNKKEDVNKLIITASGGSFRDLTREQLKTVTLKQALAHPNWSMGHKITIDSATMMNKGFEVIEAHWLFDIDYDRIETVLHKESIIHSMVEYIDHSIIAQLGVSDMRVPIQYALSYPERIENNVKSLDLTDVAALHFNKMDFERYPLLKLAFEVGQKGGNLAAIMNGANEEAVRMFLNEEISFLEIEEFIFKCVEKANYIASPSLQEIIDSDKWAHEFVRNIRKVY